MPHSAAPKRDTTIGKLSGLETRILLRLQKGARVLRQTGGHARLGALNVPAAFLDRLTQADLLEWDGDSAVLSVPGSAFVARLQRAKVPGEDAFTAQHQDIETSVVEIDGAKEKVRRNRAESPLWWLKSRKGTDGRPIIDDLQFAAGERLREDWEMAQLGPKMTMSWSGLPPERGARGAGMGPDLPPGALRAKERVGAALAHCGGGLGDIVLRVCCKQEGLGEAESALGWPRRSAKLILVFGLDRLAQFYGLHAGQVPR